MNLVVEISTKKLKKKKILEREQDRWKPTYKKGFLKKIKHSFTNSDI